MDLFSEALKAIRSIDISSFHSTEELIGAITEVVLKIIGLLWVVRRFIDVLKK